MAPALGVTTAPCLCVRTDELARFISFFLGATQGVGCPHREMTLGSDPRLPRSRAEVGSRGSVVHTPRDLRLRADERPGHPARRGCIVCDPHPPAVAGRGMGVRI